jgi:hypothetical protein
MTAVQDKTATPGLWFDDQGASLKCDCRLMAVNPGSDDSEMKHRWELHELLLGIEQMDALDAVELMADVMSCEIWPMESDEIAVFAGQHCWTDQTKVYRIFRWLEEISNAYRKGIGRH